MDVWLKLQHTALFVAPTLSPWVHSISCSNSLTTKVTISTNWHWSRFKATASICWSWISFSSASGNKNPMSIDYFARNLELLSRIGVSVRCWLKFISMSNERLVDCFESVHFYTGDKKIWNILAEILSLNISNLKPVKYFSGIRLENWFTNQSIMFARHWKFKFQHYFSIFQKKFKLFFVI